MKILFSHHSVYSLNHQSVGCVAFQYKVQKYKVKKVQKDFLKVVHMKQVVHTNLPYEDPITLHERDLEIHE